MKGTVLRSGDTTSDKTPAERAPNTTSPDPSVPRRSGDRDMGTALRKVYQHAVEEAIPSEMLDLLGKLD